MKMLTNETTITSLNLDAWGQTYVGAQWVVTSELPDKHWQADARHHALSQLVVVASHHLVEVMLFKCLEAKLIQSPEKYAKERKGFELATMGTVRYSWCKEILNGGVDWEAEPLKSAWILSRRRNETVHKKSALATLQMARSALFTAVEASKAIDNHFKVGSPFRYLKVVEKYPIIDELLFSEMSFPERPGEKEMHKEITLEGGRGNDAKPKQ